PLHSPLLNTFVIDAPLPAWVVVLLAKICADIDASASFARIKLTMSESPPPSSGMRYMPGHLGSARILGSSLRDLCFRVTLCGFCPADMTWGAVTQRTPSGATLGRVAAILICVPRSRARRAATRHRGLQKRAVERCGLNGAPQAEQAALTPPLPTRRHQSGRP